MPPTRQRHVHAPDRVRPGRVVDLILSYTVTRIEILVIAGCRYLLYREQQSGKHGLSQKNGNRTFFS
jgi:hypothetical protein